MKKPGTKRKSISFAENVESVENSVEAIKSHKKKKAKKDPKLEESVKPNEIEGETVLSKETAVENVEEEGDDVWSKILKTSKESGINYEDAIKDMLLEKLGAVVNNPRDEVILNEYDEFMKELSVMFEKLRRFPKMISKFLFCVRNDIVKLFDGMDEQPFKHKPWTELVLPPRFMASVAPAISLLPSGQIIDLWKTIHHNLDEECVKKLFDGEGSAGTRHFLPIVVELLSEFLSSIKVADSSIPVTQIEKTVELMVKLKDDCLAKLATGILKSEEDSRTLSSFLKLAYTWAELHALLLVYNPKYKVKNEINSIISNDSSNLNDQVLGNSSAAFNLICIHPYLDESKWCELGQTVVGSADSSSIGLLVRLVAQKMKYLKATLSKLKFSSGDKENQENVNLEGLEEKIKEHLEEAAEFIWLKQSASEWYSSIGTDEIFLLASEYLTPLKMIELANNFVRKIDSSTSRKKGNDDSISENLTDIKEEDTVELVAATVGRKPTNSILEINDNPVFCTAVILQVTGEIVRRLTKMKLEKKFLKNLNQSVLTPENQAALLQTFTTITTKTDTSGAETNMLTDQQLLKSYLNFVNDFIETHADSSKSPKKEHQDGHEFTPELIEHLLGFLQDLPLEDYSIEIRSFLCLFAVSVFITISSNETSPGGEGMRKLIGNLIRKSAWNARGSSILFGVKWNKLFQWVKGSVRDFTVLNILLKVCLKNIYISAKFIEEFQPMVDALSEELTLESALCSAGLITLEFLTEELTTSTSGPKSKLTPIIENHTRKLTQLVVKLLAQQENDIDVLIETIDQADEKTVDASAECLARVFRACVLSRRALKSLSSLKNNNKEIEIQEEMKQFRALLPPRLQAALAFLKKCQKNKSMRKLLKTNEELTRTRHNAWEFLYSICQGARDEFQSEIPEDFMPRLWSLCLGLKGNLLEKSPTLSSAVSLPKVIYQVCSTDEFGLIAESVIEEMASLASEEGQTDETKLAIVTHLVDNLIDVELDIEKKRLRTRILEEYLSNFLLTTIHWKDFSASHYIPVLDLQLKILRRRNVLCSLELLANCFASITSVPLRSIEDISVFRKVFCKAADLLNAFTYMRLDVVSSRTHITLQCFEILVENLTERADQKNKLTDGEIFDLRYCAHSIERVCQSAKTGQKEFSRVSPYFVAILMRQLDMCTVYPAVKIPLMSGCYKLLDLCDDHGVAQMNSMLSVGAREIFKTTFDLYKKFYRYTGKV